MQNEKPEMGVDWLARQQVVKVSFQHKQVSIQITMKSQSLSIIISLERYQHDILRLVKLNIIRGYFYTDRSQSVTIFYNYEQNAFNFVGAA